MKLTIRIVLILCFTIRRTAGYRLPLLPHKYKISFYKGTTVTRIDPIDDNVHGFILEPFNRLLDEARVYHEHEAVDVIGSVVAIGDVVLVQSSSGPKIRRTVVIEDDELVYDHYIFCLQLLDIQRKNICLTYIECMLRSNNKSLKDMQNMPYPDQDYTMVGYNRLINDETTYKKEQLSEQHVRLYDSLTSKQKGIYSTVIDAVDNNKGDMFFIYVYGGTGKTYLYKTMSAALRSKGDIVLNVASSGIAALLLEGGRTAHSRSDPLVASDKDVVNATINASYLWDHCTVLRLTVNMRLAVGSTESEKKEIQESADWILDIGNGKVGGRNDGESNVVFPDNMLIPETDDDVGDEKSYESSDSVCLADDDSNFDDSIYTTEFLNGLRMAGVPHHNINLKIGAPVMLMRNIDQRARLCNGTMLQVLRMGTNIIEAKIISGGSVGTVCAILRMVISPTDTKMPFKLNRRLSFLFKFVLP
ncbi:ATP-dependent DNA helicase PIF1-like protein [Tanacetum coccineum]